MAYRQLLFNIFFGFVMILIGCSENNVPVENDFLIKSSHILITENEFLDELDLKRSAYPYNIKESPEEYNQLVVSLVKMLVEETILLTAAAEKNITVNAAELEAAEAEFKKDYPEDSFEQLLLKNAIPYPFWLKRFKKQMIMEKLIQQELRNTIEIGPDDIIAFYQENQHAQNSKNAAGGSVIQKIENEKELVNRLKYKKTQELYDIWLQDLVKKHPVEINDKGIKAFLIETGSNKE